ncbi:MAG: Uma2 family endonuclease [Verrucomicrobia bacterium]|nr:Uma2 family endonuclease [Verrucomicrobiota bacterium]
MSQPYEEIIRGETLLRLAPDVRHEQICERLHRLVELCVAQLSSTRLLASRSVVQLAAGTMLRPDLALVTSANGKLWLAVEIVNSQDHRIDTVTKKAIYEEINLPRLWMVDPRYDNVEVYHSSPYGLALKGILASREVLQENLLPNFRVTIANLFKADASER